MNISSAIIEQATVRGKEKTICPSEVARKLWPNKWREHMEEVRKVAFTLRNSGRILITQKGQTVTVDDVTGPIRIQIV